VRLPTPPHLLRHRPQVACNGLVPTALALAAAWLSGGADVALRPAEGAELAALGGAFMGYYACCCGDTWASELGQLSPEEPRLITTLRPVRRGTNGGVTLAGSAASAAGGLLVGAVFYLAGVLSPTGNCSAGSFHCPGATTAAQWALVPIGAQQPHLAAAWAGALPHPLGSRPLASRCLKSRRPCPPPRVRAIRDAGGSGGERD
jgi:hypothetical protein